MSKSVLKPLTVADCMEYPALPDTHRVVCDLYWCARENCKRCTKKFKKWADGCTDGCRRDLLEEAGELLEYYEHK